VAYSIELLPSAARSLSRLPRRTQQRVGAAIDRLAEEPRHDGVIKLAGHADMYRVHVGRDYVVVFTIADRKLRVLVIAIGDRKDIYRNLPKRPPEVG
jgi:mRNA interferase RelE/StbE